MKLEKIEQATAKNNSIYHKLTIDGKTYVYWNELGDLKTGDEVICQFEKKGQYRNLIDIKKGSSTQAQIQAPNISEGIMQYAVIHSTDRPNSYEFGKAGSRHKIYYKDIEDLAAQIKALQAFGLIDPSSYGDNREQSGDSQDSI